MNLEDFAERVRPLKAEGAYAVLARAKALEAQGRSIIHLEIGQPDFPTPEHIAEAGIQAIRAGRTRYTPPAGTADLRATIAEVAGKWRGMTFSPEEVIVGPGAKPAIYFAALALVEPGEEVIIPDPGFPSYSAIVRLAGGVPVPVRLDPDELYNFDMQDFRQKISHRTKLVIMNSPSNPTGGVTPLHVLEQIAAEVQRVGAWVISDEIYCQLVYEGDAPSIAALPGMRERTIIVDGFSKTYSMTGWRLGFGIMPPALAERVGLLATHTIGCTADFTQAAGVAALRGDFSTVEVMRESFRQRRDLTVAALNTLPGVRCAMPKGAFYVFPDVRSYGRSSRELADYLLEEAGVALLAGSDFGPGGEGFLRISYATAWEQIREGIERMRQALARL
ncbi:MAG: pyridoxal phosphate-dependent aminotransferase [Anaerolineae bacterium]|nr:pyridoxal phosphate-dependent aminotransferase [Anaerolineae bacterium]